MSLKHQRVFFKDSTHNVIFSKKPGIGNVQDSMLWVRILEDNKYSGHSLPGFSKLWCQVEATEKIQIESRV
jgi:hypothetical protein